MKIQKFEFNPFPVNTYILYDETSECVIIDAGMLFDEEKAMIDDFINSNNLKINCLINTHLHFDHVLGVSYLQNKYGVQFAANEADLFLLDRLQDQATMFGMSFSDKTPTLDKNLEENDTVTFGNATLQVLHVPGHSPGSLIFYSADESCLFAGDVLFDGSIGRTDLPGGNYEELIHGIKSKLLTLPPNTTVYSGHGSETTIGNEKRTNPFLS